MSDQVAGCISVAMGLAAGAYAVFGWRRGRIRFVTVSTRADGPLSFWSAVICAGLWGAITAGAGIYMILR